MSIRYVLAPEAAADLVEIWRYIKQEADVEMADRVEAVIREKIDFLAQTPGGGHWISLLASNAKLLVSTTHDPHRQVPKIM